MFPPPSTRARVVVRSVPGEWPGERAAGEPIKDHAGGTVWRGEAFGRECVLKVAPLNSIRDLARAHLRLSRAWRHWRNARRLGVLGVETAPALAIVRGTGRRRVECLVLGFVPGGTLLAHMAAGDLSPSETAGAAASVGRLAATLALAGVRNRDAKPSNLVLQETGAICVIDADLRRCPRGDERAAASMLASALIEPTGCGCPPPLPVRMRAVLAAAGVLDPASPRAASRRLWRMAAAIVSTHGDPTPRDNPLG